MYQTTSLLLLFLLLNSCRGLYSPATSLSSENIPAEPVPPPIAGVQSATKHQFAITEISSFPENVYGMAIDKNGILYFSDTYSKMDSKSRVYTLNPPYTGKPHATKIASKSIAGLMWYEGKLYVAYLNQNEVVVFDEALEFQVSYYVDSPLNFSSDGKNVYVVTYYGNLGLIKPGRIKMYMKDLQSPFDIHYSDNQTLYVTEKGENGVPGRVLEIGSGEGVLNTLMDRLQSPHGLATDIYNNLYVAETGADRILIVTPDRETILVTDQYDSPICFARNDHGEILVSTNHNGGTLLLIQPHGFAE